MKITGIDICCSVFKLNLLWVKKYNKKITDQVLFVSFFANFSSSTHSLLSDIFETGSQTHHSVVSCNATHITHQTHHTDRSSSRGTFSGMCWSEEGTWYNSCFSAELTCVKKLPVCDNLHGKQVNLALHRAKNTTVTGLTKAKMSWFWKKGNLLELL